MPHFTRSLFIVLIVGGFNLVGLSNSTWAQEKHPWPQFRGPTGMGLATQKGLPLTWSEVDNVVWKTELPGAGTSTPILAGGRIFITCYSGYNVPGKPAGSMEDLVRHVVCLDPMGAIVWDKTVDSKLPEQETIRDAHGYASSTPAADDKQIYVFFGKSGVFAFDYSGRQVWQTDVGSKLHGWGSAASPVLYGDLVIVNASVESEALVALDKKTGREVWRASGINESWNTPVLVKTAEGQTELVLAKMGKVLGLDPAKGTELWSCDTDITWYMVPSLVAQDGIVYCLGGRSGIGGLAVRAGGRGDVTDSHRLWTRRNGSNVSSPVFHEGHLYWMNEHGMAYCAEGKTGESVYEERFERPGQVYASSVLAEGRIYHVSRDGRVWVIAAEPKFKQLAMNQLGERSTYNAGFAVGNGRLYLRNDKHLYCLGK